LATGCAGADLHPMRFVLEMLGACHGRSRGGLLRFETNRDGALEIAGS